MIGRRGASGGGEDHPKPCMCPHVYAYDRFFKMRRLRPHANTSIIAGNAYKRNFTIAKTDTTTLALITTNTMTRAGKCKYMHTHTQLGCMFVPTIHTFVVKVFLWLGALSSTSCTTRTEPRRSEDWPNERHTAICNARLLVRRSPGCARSDDLLHPKIIARGLTG